MIFILTFPLYMIYLCRKYVKFQNLGLLIKIENLFDELKADKNKTITFNIFLYYRKFIFSLILVSFYGYTRL